MLTLRIQPDLLAKAEARAAALGFDRGRYLRELIERDLAGSKEAPRKFASEDFVGSAKLGKGPYTNQRVRAAVRARLKDRHETHR
jgi:hypothetical protein